MNGITKEAVLVHDCWKAHFQNPVKKHQLCTAHLERETKYLEERYKVDWPIRFRTNLENELECLLKEPLDPKHQEMVSFQVVEALIVPLIKETDSSYYY
jgi:hypothetical protein